MSDDLEEKVTHLRSAVTKLVEHDDRIRAQTVELSRSLADECRRGRVAAQSENFIIEEGIDQTEDIYGYIGVSTEGIWLAYRSGPDDLEDYANGIPPEDRLFHLSKPDAWPVQWLRRILTEQRLAKLIDGVREQADSIVEGHAALSERVARVNHKPSTEIEQSLRGITTELGFTKVMQDWADAQRELHRSPASAIRAACVLLETTLKHLIKHRSIPLPVKMDVQSLYATLAKNTPPLIAEREASNDVDATLRGLATVVQHLGALRTKIGDAHGKSPGQLGGGLDEARLAVDAAGAVAVYLMRKLAKPPSPITSS